MLRSEHSSTPFLEVGRSSSEQSAMGTSLDPEDADCRSGSSTRLAAPSPYSILTAYQGKRARGKRKQVLASGKVGGSERSSRKHNVKA